MLVASYGEERKGVLVSEGERRRSREDGFRRVVVVQSRRLRKKSGTDSPP